MNNSSYWISLDIHDTASQVSISVKKGDNSRKICASLTENGKGYVIADGCSAVFTAKKPDGTKLYNDCVIEDNSIQYVVTNNTTSAVGLTECEFRLLSPEDKLLVCPRFTLIVEDTVVDDDDVMDSSDEFSALSKMVGKVERADSVAQEALEVAGEAVERAESTHGIYVGSGDMPEGYDVQIDPEGEALLLDNAMSDTSENVPKTKVVKAYVDGTAKELENYVDETAEELLDMVYPVGSIYMSVNAADPSVLFGGTWEQLKDRFLLGAGDSYAAGATGGEATHTLTTAEMPTHAHSIKQYTANSSGLSGATKAIVPDSITDADRTYRASAVADSGGGAAHNNMPPYLVVYMWQRVA